MNNATKHSASKTEFGYYIYRGYKIEHVDNREYGGDDGWNVYAPHVDICDDRFSTLRDSKHAIDRIEAARS